MKTRRIITLLILSVVSISLIIFTWMDLIYAYRNERMSTFIIGEVGGPTSTLVTNTSHNYMLYGVTIIIIAITLVSSIRYGRKRK